MNFCTIFKFFELDLPQVHALENHFGILLQYFSEKEESNLTGNK